MCNGPGVPVHEPHLQCPYESCSRTCHDIVSIGFSKPIRCLKGVRRRRFKCKHCLRSFSENSLKLSFRLKNSDPALNYKIFSLCMHGLSNRKISRLLSISEHSVRIRLERMSRRALEFHHSTSSQLSIDEPIAFDGLENFASSQYEPNNIQQAIGRDSLFIYDFNFASLNRKGRMSIWQKRKLAQIVEKKGRFNPKNIRIATVDILQRLATRSPNGKPIVLLSDEHFQYRKALQYDLAPRCFEHLTVSSKACRNYQNILFAVNHADLLARQNIAAFSRETISFSKTHGRMCQKFALFMVHKNYMSSQFTKAQVRRLRAHEESPAQKLGITKKILSFADVFGRRALDWRVKEMSEDWQYFWNAEVPEKYHRNLKFVAKA